MGFIQEMKVYSKWFCKRKSTHLDELSQSIIKPEIHLRQEIPFNSEVHFLCAGHLEIFEMRNSVMQMHIRHYVQKQTLSKA